MGGGDGGGDGGGMCRTPGGGGPTGGPIDLFPCDSFWYQDISNAPMDPNSAAIVGAIGSWESNGTTDLLIDFSIVFMHADASTPRYTFSLDPNYDPDNDHDPVPVPANGAIEGVSNYTCDYNNNDCHLLVVDDSTHKLFELWQASSTGTNTWRATQESVWDLDRHYDYRGRGLGCTSADAGGLAIAPGLIGVRETRAGKISHALRFTLPNKYIRTGPSFVPPATHGTAATSSAMGPPYGARLRLRKDYPEAGLPAAAVTIVHALKTYGMIVADGSNFDTLIAEADTVEQRLDPTLTWSGVLAADDLKAIQPTDFEVLTLGTITGPPSPDCTRVP
jgi:hypothetical protein